MNAPNIPDADPRTPTPAEQRMAQSINFLVGALLRGELGGISLAAINNEGEHSCFYLNSADTPVLRAPMERLKVMYETQQSFRAMEQYVPLENRSYRSH